MFSNVKGRPSAGTMAGVAGLAVAVIAIVLSAGGIATGTGSASKATTVRSNSVQGQSENENNGNYHLYKVAKSCKPNESALSASAFWSGARGVTNGTGENDDELLVSIKRNSNRKYTAEGAADVDGSATPFQFNIQVLCKG